MRKDRNRSSQGGSRRDFLTGTLVGGVAAAMYPALGAAREMVPSSTPPDVPTFELEEMTIGDLQEGMKTGKYTARAVTEKYLARIEAVDKSGPAVNSVIEVNPDAAEIAESLDRERK